MTMAPFAANFSAAASPMPDDAPVSRIRLPATSMSPRACSRSVSGGRMLVSSSCSEIRRSGFLLMRRVQETQIFPGERTSRQP